MAINPYTTPADYKYMPIPFREMMAAGMQADKRLGNLLQNSAKLNQDIKYRRGDAEDARKQWQNTQNRLNNLTSNIYSNPSKYDEHIRELYAVSQTITDPFGKTVEFANRLDQQTALEKQVRDAKIGGDEEKYLLQQIGAKDKGFEETWDPATGKAAEIKLDYDAGIPNYLDGAAMQDQVNKIMSNVTKTLVSSGDLSDAEGVRLENELGQGKTIWQAAKIMGIPASKIRKALALSANDDMINSAQLRADAKGYYTNNDPTDERNFSYVDEQGDYQFVPGTEIGNLFEGTTAAAESYEETKEKIELNDKKIKDTRTARQKAEEKEAALWETGHETKYLDIDNDPTTPQELIDLLYGDIESNENNEGLYNKKRSLEKEIEDHKKGEGAQTFTAGEVATKQANLNYTNQVIANIETLVNRYKQDTKGMAKLRVHEQQELEHLQKTIPNYEPTQAGVRVRAIVQSPEFKRYYDNEKATKTSSTGKYSVQQENKPSDDRSIINRYIKENLKDTSLIDNIKGDDMTYAVNQLEHNKQKKDINFEIAKELQKDSTTILDQADGLDINVQTFPEVEGEYDKSDDPGQKIVRYISESPRAYRYYTILEDGKLKDHTDDMIDKFDKGYLSTTKLVSTTSGDTREATNWLQGVGMTTGSGFISENSNGYVAANYYEKGKKTQLYIEPIEGSSADQHSTFWQKVRDTYETSELYGEKGILKPGQKWEGDAAQADRMFYAPQEADIKEALGGFNITMGEGPKPPKIEKLPNGQIKAGLQVYGIPMADENAIQFNVESPIHYLSKQDQVYDPKTKSIIWSSVPVAPPMKVYHGSDGSISSVGPDGKPIRHTNWAYFTDYAKRERAYYEGGARIASSVQLMVDNFRDQNPNQEVPGNELQKYINIATQHELSQKKISRMATEKERQKVMQRMQYLTQFRVDRDGKITAPWSILNQTPTSYGISYPGPEDTHIKKYPNYDGPGQSTEIGTKEPTFGMGEPWYQEPVEGFVPPKHPMDSLGNQ